MRVHSLRFARRDAKERWIKEIDIGQKPARTRRYATDRRRVRIVERFVIPAVGRHRRDRIDPIIHKPPEAGGVVTAARHPTTEADDGDRPPRCQRGLGKTAFSFLESQEGALQRRQVFESWSNEHFFLTRVYGF